ncbi:MAG: acetylornithine transaminase [Euryarchaeota archaeon]|nr:acetylornithine transaminase [Euryarchaeota archaeon]
MNTQEIMDMDQKFVMQTYGRQKLALSHGKGVEVWDVEGNSYLDCFAGVAVNNLGHSHPKVTLAICHQAQRMIHCSNIYYTQEQAELAQLLTQISPHDKVFLANSGAEANEGAIKLARKFTGKGEIIATDNSFHGRTLATVTATGQDKYKIPFKPLPAGFKHVPYGDISAMMGSLSEDTAAIILEPIQGEGGVIIPPKGYLKDVENLCRQKDVLLIMDEVQTGFGRTGEMFASQHEGIQPDITTVAKAMGGGYPIAAVLANSRIAEAFQPGDHGSTFGGNPLGCAAAKAAIEVLLDENLVNKSKEMGNYLQKKLEELKSKYSLISEIRGRGLLIGIEITMDCSQVVKKACEKGVLINCTAGKVIRLAPPLLINMTQMDKLVNVLDEVFAELS